MTKFKKGDRVRVVNAGDSRLILSIYEGQEGVVEGASGGRIFPIAVSGLEPRIRYFALEELEKVDG